MFLSIEKQFIISQPCEWFFFGHTYRHLFALYGGILWCYLNLLFLRTCCELTEADGNEILQLKSPPVIQSHDVRNLNIRSKKFYQNKLYRHFMYIFYTISACMVEFVLYALCVCTLYLVNITGNTSQPVDMIQMLLLHTFTTSLLYSPSYNPFKNTISRGFKLSHWQS